MEGNIASAIGPVYENGLIIKELFNIFNDVSCGKSNKEMFTNLLKGVGKSVLVMLIAYLIKQQNHHFSLLAKLFASRYLYRTMKLPSYAKLFKVEYESVCETYNKTHQFPIYYHTLNEQPYYQYIPYIHTGFINELIHSVEQRKLEYDKDDIRFFDLNKQKITPDILFPSQNFLRLENIIRRHIEFVNMSSQFINIPILIDGCPGLGKSSCLSYLAEKRVCKSLIRVDMTQHFDSDFSDVVSKLKGTDEEHRIVLVDELDKWFAQTLQNNFLCEKEENKDVIRADFELSYKTNFLYELLQLIEKRNGKTITVFIFCCNNFDSIFENVNSRHFASLRDRFIPVHFEMCDKRELIEYLRYTNKRFVSQPTFYVEENKLELIFDKINQEMALPFRKLTQMFIISGYDFEKFVRLANAYRVCCEESSECENVDESDNEVSSNSTENTPKSENNDATEKPKMLKVSDIKDLSLSCDLLMKIICVESTTRYNQLLKFIQNKFKDIDIMKLLQRIKYNFFSKAFIDTSQSLFNTISSSIHFCIRILYLEIYYHNLFCNEQFHTGYCGLFSGLFDFLLVFSKSKFGVKQFKIAIKKCKPCDETQLLKEFQSVQAKISIN